MFAIGVSGTPQEFTRDITTAMYSPGFSDTSPGGCFYFPFYFCWEPTYYPKDGDGTTGATVVTAGYTFPSGLHLGVVYENRQLGGVLGWNAQAGQLNLSAKGRNLAMVVGFEKPFSRGDDFGNRLHGRATLGPAISTVRVLASGSGASSATSTTRVGLLLEAGISCRTRSVFVLDLSLQRWQLGKYDVGPYTVTSGSGSQEFARTPVERSHTGVYFSVGVRP